MQKQSKTLSPPPLALSNLLSEAMAEDEKTVVSVDKSLIERCEAICPLLQPRGDCSPSSSPAARRKRSLQIPNATFLSIQSRLIVPQPPIGVYLIWIRVRLVLRSLFTEQTA